MKKSGKRERPFELFVREYMAGFVAGESPRQIARRLETTENALFVYAAQLRRNGVRLPRFTDRFDAKALNKIIAKAKKERGAVWAR